MSIMFDNIKNFFINQNYWIAPVASLVTIIGGIVNLIFWLLYKHKKTNFTITEIKHTTKGISFLITFTNRNQYYESIHKINLHYKKFQFPISLFSYPIDKFSGAFVLPIQIKPYSAYTSFAQVFNSSLPPGRAKLLIQVDDKIIKLKFHIPHIQS